jgi:UDP-N-acetylglucosamine 4,6-dehydratase
MARSLSVVDYPALRYFLGDVRDHERLEMAFRGVDIVVHAAALKQVQAAEYNPFECIHTNVIGAENVVRAAIRAGVKKVVALSTDKAANPVSLYGASKLAADKIFVAANHLSGEGGTRFSVVRYGNVIGSRGSVVPFFQKLILDNATALPITHPEMTRFWITLNQAVNFVLSSISLMQGGEIFVPKVPSMLVADIARALAPELPHTIVGIRPGEKLHETLITEDEARTTRELEDRFVVLPGIRFWRNASFDSSNKVHPRFAYTSDRNPIKLDIEGFLNLLVQAERLQGDNAGY